ncbi:hypothetical protein [Streptomyces carpaticus]|uniref:PRL2-8 n=1 Tax=Streptomyces carpaticus TaxID=285558 RepID=A0ABV4ZUF4_9ACTN
MTEVEYGLGYRAEDPDRPPSMRRGPRHVWWYDDGGSKCGQLVLVERTTDMSLPLCGMCARSMSRLVRERGRSVPPWR